MQAHSLESSVYGPTSHAATMYFDNIQGSLSWLSKIKEEVGYDLIKTLKKGALIVEAVPMSKWQSHVTCGSCGYYSNHMLKFPLRCGRTCCVTDAD